MIVKTNGNLLLADTEALADAVNCAGSMGKGIALQFKQARPAMFADYERLCRAGQLHPGQMHVWKPRRRRGRDSSSISRPSATGASNPATRTSRPACWRWPGRSANGTSVRSHCPRSAAERRSALRARLHFVPATFLRGSAGVLHLPPSQTGVS